MKKRSPKMAEWPSVATFHDRKSAPDAVPWGRWRLVENMATADGTWQLRCGWRRFGHWTTYADQADLRVRPDDSEARLRSIYVHVDPSGKRRLFAASSSIYSQYNDGRWRTLLIGTGSEAYHFASVGTRVFATNNDGPVLYHELDTASFSEIPDLTTIGLSRAGTVIAWKGILFLADVVMDHIRVGHRVVWSDLENPLSFDPTTDSIAGFQDLDPGETILVGVPMGDSLYLFTTHSVWRVTVVGGEAYFSFQQVYHDRNGAGCLISRNALVTWKDTAIYLSRDGIQTFGSYSATPDQPAWMYHATAAIPTEFSRCREISFAIRSQWGELWISYPHGDSEVANRTTVLNLDYQSSDEIDHGYTTMAPAALVEGQQELLEWARETFGCSSDSLDALFPPAPGETRPEFAGTRKTIEEVCASIEHLDCSVSCPSPERFIVVSAEDDSLKSVESDYFARDQYGSGGYEAQGYGARWLTGAVHFESTDWKRLIEVVLAMIPEVADDPRTVTLKVSVSGTAGDVLASGCNLRTFTLNPRDIACPAASATLQPNAHFRWPLVAEGRYLYLDFVVSSGVGGPFTVSRIHAQFTQSPNSTL